jgi:hypothetical protein
VLRKRFAASVPKDPAAPELNEDSLGCDESRQVFVLSDGASESFNSRLWSRILVGVGLEVRPRSPRGFCQALRHCINVYDDWCRGLVMTWAEEAAFARGSFATLLAVRAARGAGDALVLGTGDSLAVLAAGNEIVSTFPYTSAEQFAERPHLLSTRAALNRLGGIDIVEALRSLCREEPAGPIHRKWRLEGMRDARVVCVTDAVGAWLLDGESRGEPRLRRLLEIASAEELRSLVEEERRQRRMRLDDSTLLVLGWDDGPADA